MWSLANRKDTIYLGLPRARSHLFAALFPTIPSRERRIESIIGGWIECTHKISSWNWTVTSYVKHGRTIIII